jgi:hypothetical protein
MSALFTPLDVGDDQRTGNITSTNEAALMSFEAAGS